MPTRKVSDRRIRSASSGVRLRPRRTGAALRAVTGVPRRRRPWMYWGQLPNACSTSTRSPSFPASDRVPLTRRRLRAANSTAISPTGWSVGRPRSGSSSAGDVRTVRAVGEPTWRNPGGPVSGESHSVPSVSRAVIAAKVRSARNCATPVLSRAGAIMAESRAASLETPARRCTASSPSWKPTVSVRAGPVIVDQAVLRGVTTGQSLSTSARMLK
nr:hypothetical protein [Saccharothrix deserti]